MKIDLRRFDLNLLVVFDALMIEKNVTKAAERVFVSQSAVSHALKRLRALLDDPLLVKTEHGMKPTPRALSLEVPIRSALNQIQKNMLSADPFDPLSSRASFVISCSEYFECILFPILAERLAKIAPHMTIGIDVLPSRIPESRLTSGEVDFVVAFDHPEDLSTRLQVQPLLQDTLACAARKDHPTVGDSISLEQLSNVIHVYNSEFQSDIRFKTSELPGQMDQWFEKHKITRQIAVITAAYFAVALITTRTDHVIVIPRRVADKMVEFFNIKTVTLLESLPSVTYNLIWHPLYEHEPSHNWFRRQLLDIADQIDN